MGPIHAFSRKVSSVLNVVSALEIGDIILHDIIILIVATGTSARCGPDAMNENFTKVDPQLARYFRRVYIKRLLYKWFKYMQII